MQKEPVNLKISFSQTDLYTATNKQKVIFVKSCNLYHQLLHIKPLKTVVVCTSLHGSYIIQKLNVSSELVNGLCVSVFYEGKTVQIRGVFSKNTLLRAP